MALFTPLQIRELKFRNRIAVSPMCQYSAQAGVVGPWHMVHLGSRAVGGAGMVMVEASAVSPEGRISPEDVGIWNDEQVQALMPIAEFVRAQGAIVGLQLAHAGRKASSKAPWVGHGPLEPGSGWQTLGPSGLPFAEGWPAPKAMDENDMQKVLEEFVQAAKHSLAAGFQLVEVHAAHGYLLHEFLSPISNQRTDQYGGSLANRMRFPFRVIKAVREIWPEKWPVFVRISASDWVDGGWNIEESIEFSRELKKIGIDLIDCSSGGAVAHAKIPVQPHYQVDFAEAIRKQAQIATGAVGLITEPVAANGIVEQGQADMVFLARELLRDPYWPLHAAKVLGKEIKWPNQYQRAQT